MHNAAVINQQRVVRQFAFETEPILREGDVIPDPKEQPLESDTVD